MRRVLTLLLFLLVSGPALAQNVSVSECSSFDTSTTWTSTFALLGRCNVITGPAGVIYAVISGETLCGSGGQFIQAFVNPGTSTVNGSNFLGQVSAGVLSLNSIIPGIFPSFTIVPGQQYLTGGTGVIFAPTLITGQIDGVTGGLGRYNIANSSLSEPANTNMYALAQLPVGMTAITPVMSQSGCQGGFVITTIGGVFTGAPNTQYWVAVQMHSGVTSQSSTFNNSQWAILTY